MISILRTAVFAAFLSAGCALAEWTPTRPIHIVVGFAPGGQPDVVARALAAPLSRALGQPVIVENRVGAGGNLAAEVVAKSAPDGYTLLMGTNGPLTISPAINHSLPYDPVRDFEPVILVGRSPNLIAVNPSLKVKTFAQLIEKARMDPGLLNYSSVGKGSISHLTMEMINNLGEINTVHIPYTGGAPAVSALVAGQVDILSLNSTMVVPQAEAGKLVILAQTSARRSPLVYNVPTTAEYGYNIEVDVWMAIMAPANTPAPVIARLYVELEKIIADAELKRTLWDRQWIDPSAALPWQVSGLIKRENDKWARIIRQYSLDLQ